jgi:hypothetical protein
VDALAARATVLVRLGVDKHRFTAEFSREVPGRTYESSADVIDRLYAELSKGS